MAKVNQQAITDSIIYSRNKLNRTAENWKSIEWEPSEEQEEANQLVNSLKNDIEGLTPFSSELEYNQVLDSLNNLSGHDGLSNKGEAYVKVAEDLLENKQELRNQRSDLLNDLNSLYTEIDNAMASDKFGEFDSSTVLSLENQLTEMVNNNATFLNQNIDMPTYFNKLKNIDEWVVSQNLLKGKDELPLELINIDLKSMESDGLSFDQSDLDRLAEYDNKGWSFYYTQDWQRPITGTQAATSGNEFLTKWNDPDTGVESAFGVMDATVKAVSQDFGADGRYNTLKELAPNLALIDIDAAYRSFTDKLGLGKSDTEEKQASYRKLRGEFYAYLIDEANKIDFMEMNKNSAQWEKNVIDAMIANYTSSGRIFTPEGERDVTIGYEDHILKGKLDNTLNADALEYYKAGYRNITDIPANQGFVFEQGQNPFNFTSYNFDTKYNKNINQGVGQEILNTGVLPTILKPGDSTKVNQRGDFWESPIPNDSMFNDWLRDWARTGPGQRYINENQLNLNSLGTDTTVREFSNNSTLTWAGLMHAYTTHLNNEFVKNNYSHQKDNNFGASFADIDMEALGASFNSFTNTVGATFGTDNISGFENLFIPETIGFQTNTNSSEGLKVVHDNLLHQAFDSYALGQGAAASKYIAGANQSLLSAYNIETQLQDQMIKEQQDKNWVNFNQTLDALPQDQLSFVKNFFDASGDLNLQKAILEDSRLSDVTREFIINVSSHQSGMNVYPSKKMPITEIMSKFNNYGEGFAKEQTSYYDSTLKMLDDTFHQKSTASVSGIGEDLLEGLPFSDIHTPGEELFIDGKTLNTTYLNNKTNMVVANIQHVLKEMDSGWGSTPNVFSEVLRNLYKSKTPSDFSTNFEAFISDPDTVYIDTNNNWALTPAFRSWIMRNTDNEKEGLNTVAMMESYLQLYNQLESFEEDNQIGINFLSQGDGSNPYISEDDQKKIDFQTQLTK